MGERACTTGVMRRTACEIWLGLIYVILQWIHLTGIESLSHKISFFDYNHQCALEWIRPMQKSWHFWQRCSGIFHDFDFGLERLKDWFICRVYIRVWMRRVISSSKVVWGVSPQALLKILLQLWSYSVASHVIWGICLIANLHEAEMPTEVSECFEISLFQ